MGQFERSEGAMKTKELAWGALLIALALLIPLAFGGVKISTSSSIRSFIRLAILMPFSVIANIASLTQIPTALHAGPFFLISLSFYIQGYHIGVLGLGVKGYHVDHHKIGV